MTIQSSWMSDLLISINFNILQLNMTDNDNIENYHGQISLARTEIKNLRQQISALKHEHQKEIRFIRSKLTVLRCANCAEAATTCISNGVAERLSAGNLSQSDGYIRYNPIGVIETSFQTKRGVPRQPTVLDKANATVVIDHAVFNNPEHALSGLEEFSHMWIIFHFHATDSSNVPAKVSPPRLQGDRRGVLSTRSPHRPCPIGLSLVKIQKIEGNKIHFHGVDMINGTPVLDVKPYIPEYDYPTRTYGNLSTLMRPPTEGISEVVETVANLQLDDDDDVNRLTHPIAVDTSNPIPPSPYDGDIPSPITQITPVSPSGPPNVNFDGVYATSPLRRLDYERGAPDGQERFTPPQSAVTNRDGIRVAPWIVNPPAQRFDVQFTDDALLRLTELIGDRTEAFKNNIQSLLSEDPRSNYVKTRYPDHEYSCVLEDIAISCVFNADTGTCTIVTVMSADEMQN